MKYSTITSVILLTVLTSRGLEAQEIDLNLVSLSSVGDVPSKPTLVPVSAGNGAGENQLTGPDASHFKVRQSPPAGPGADLNLTYDPPKSFIGRSRAILSIDQQEPITLRGLSSRALEGENEPPLHDVLHTLGHDVNLGWTTLQNHVRPKAQGDELMIGQFVRAGQGGVSIIPLARYSPPFPLPFGYYTVIDGKPTLHRVGQLSGDQSYPEHQTLHPAIDQGGTSFDPGDEPFGLYNQSPTHVAYTDDRLNKQLEPKHIAHAARIYAAKDAAGSVLTDQYLICFEEARNGDYQDYVFLLTGARPAGL